MYRIRPTGAELDSGLQVEEFSRRTAVPYVLIAEVGVTEAGGVTLKFAAL